MPIPPVRPCNLRLLTRLLGASIGTAVATGLVHQLASREEPINFAGLVLVAPFTDVKTLTSTYRVAGTVPLLDPVARFPRLLDFLNTFIRDKWPSKERLADFVRICEGRSHTEAHYHISIIHAEDDYDIPWHHSEEMFWAAANASASAEARDSREEFQPGRELTERSLGSGGRVLLHKTARGVIRTDITKHGLHDRIMGYPIVSMAVMRAFGLE